MDDQQKELDFMKVVALQAQMNPHFIFNILGVLKSEISEGNISIAKDMVVKLSTLVRKYLEATSLDIGNKRKSIFSTEITIEEELELLRLFVEFEHIKANSNFSYDFKIDDNVFTNNLTIPPMIIQPIVENAIKHGLLDLPRGITGSLEINVSYCLKILCFEIKDTGVGFKKSAEIKSKTVRHHKSKGESLVKERIRLLNEAGYKITLYPPKDLEPHGTQIIVCLDNNW
jgi:sensor histidine kinase YesM